MFDDIDLDLFMFWQKPITYSILLWTTDEYPDTENHVYSPHKKILSNATVVINVQSKGKIKKKSALRENYYISKLFFPEIVDRSNLIMKWVQFDGTDVKSRNAFVQPLFNGTYLCINVDLGTLTVST
ncbi:unnamed protein product [Didymodactylos carnosus]|uniref:Uncharacterized protein n=1 Tax=Didymodactylos carnosus TaxID=1234261 RepID=A0A816FAM5_9BILA|nr:unnamed protein product [Didymodactylos carnosus]CAF4598796.1 unnamed protein product [Didymodactylos carnosus]